MHLCLKLWSISLPSITKGNNKLNSCVFHRWGERGSSCHQGSTGFITEQVRFDHLHPNLPSLPSKISNQSFTQDMLSATWRCYFNDDLSGRLVIEGKYWFLFLMIWWSACLRTQLNPTCLFILRVLAVFHLVASCRSSHFLWFKTSVYLWEHWEKHFNIFYSIQKCLDASVSIIQILFKQLEFTATVVPRCLIFLDKDPAILDGEPQQLGVPLWTCT